MTVYQVGEIECVALFALIIFNGYLNVRLHIAVRQTKQLQDDLMSATAEAERITAEALQPPHGLVPCGCLCHTNHPDEPKDPCNACAKRGESKGGYGLG